MAVTASLLNDLSRGNAVGAQEEGRLYGHAAPLRAADQDDCANRIIALGSVAGTTAAQVGRRP
jgi:hypothetical protein